MRERFLNWCRRTGQSRVALVMAVLFGLVSYNLYLCCQIKQRELEDRQKEYYQLKASISMAEFQNAQMKAQVAHLSTDAGAEEVAREKLGLIKNGEMAFVVMGAKDSKGVQPAPAVEVEKADPGMLMNLMHWIFLG